jgi:predicted secreted protein
MALPGHNVVISSASGTTATFTAMDGIKSFTIDDGVNLLDITDFASSNVHARLAALRDFSIKLSGEFEVGDVGYTNVRTAFDNGLYCGIKILWGGTAGFSWPVKCESISITGAVDGKLEVSLSLQSSEGVAPLAV